MQSRPTRRVHAALIASTLVGASACASREPTIEERALGALEAAERSGAGADVLLQGLHQGPGVAAGSTGTMRFAPALHRSFDPVRAKELVAFIDRYYRAPGNDGYEAVLDRVAASLREAGFGAVEGFELSVIETPLEARGPDRGARVPAQAWTPLGGRVTLIDTHGASSELHSFAKPEARDRVMLPIHCPPCDVEGPIALSLDQLDAGEILVTDAEPLASLVQRAENIGAAAVVSSYLESYNVDPSGRFRHLDALQYRQLPYGAKLPVIMISPRSLQSIKRGLENDPQSRLKLEAQVRFDERPLRTLCARIVGADRPEEAVATVSHIQEPGACDNASGVAGLCESAMSLAKLIQEGALPRPSRSLVFVWGDEFRQSSVWLDHTTLTPVAGLSSDMTGESFERTGAIALLERMPDPGAVETLLPDFHTPWGKTEVDPSKFLPNGLALIGRCSLLDVAHIDANGAAPAWRTADHPYEGGSDHDIFIGRTLPAALFWHFTDFAYHTSLDRLEHVDESEMRRTGVALLATALALADPQPADLDRYLRSLNAEENVRVAAAQAAGDEQLAESWRRWCDGARQWLRVECLRIPETQR
jgi:aminopeptidase YwaD